MASRNKKKPGEPQKQTQLPSTGEGSDSVLDVLRNKRQQRPGVDVPPPAPKK